MKKLQNGLYWENKIEKTTKENHGMDHCMGRIAHSGFVFSGWES